MTDEEIQLAEQHQERMCDLCERHILDEYDIKKYLLLA
jgi:hypothetical protein